MEETSDEPSAVPKPVKTPRKKSAKKWENLALAKTTLKVEASKKKGAGSGSVYKST